MKRDLSLEEEKSLIAKCKEDPVFFVKEVLGVEPWAKQSEILEALRDYPNICVRSGHGVGKTFITACAVLWFLFTHKNSKVISTAPTNRQVESILWAAIHSLYNGSKFPLGGKLLRTSLSLDDEWFALGLSTDDPTRFQGHHAEDILVVFDEAPGVDSQIYDAANGLLTTKGAKWMLIGNPTSSSGQFTDMFKNPNWHKIHISCYESPAIKEPEKFPKLTTMKWIEERKEEWGEASPLFVSRVLGEFPEEGEDSLIPLSWCLKAVGKTDVKGKASCRYLGVDVARYGTAKTVVVEYSAGKIYHIDTCCQKDLMQVVGLVVKHAISLGPDLMGISCDDTGLGGGVTDRIRELGYPVAAVNFQMKPKDNRIFPGMRDEAYWELREMFRAGELNIPDDGELIAQLSAIKYKIDSRGRIHIEDKDEIRKRGLKSPDKADALMIAVYGSRNMTASRYRASRRYDHVPEIAYY